MSEQQEKARQSATRFACLGMLMCTLVILVCFTALGAIAWRLAQ